MLNMQNVKDIEITEGDVRTIHDKDNRLIWGRLAYDTKYAGNTYQQTYSGKNLFDGTYVNYAIGGSGHGWFANANSRSAVIKCSPNTVYSIKKYETSNRFVICDYPTNPTATTEINLLLSDSTLNEATVTTHSDAEYLFVFVSNASGEPQMQIEQNSSPTSYEPYTGGIPAPNPDYPQPIQVVTGEQTVMVSDGVDSEDFTISLGSTELCKIGNYQDYIYKSGGDWYVHKETNKFTVTSSLALGKSGTSANNAYYYSAGFQDIDKSNMSSGSSSTSVTPSFSAYFGVISARDIFTSGSIGMAFDKGSGDIVDFRVGFGVNSAVNTLDLFKTWLDANELKVYYPLATPTDTKITDNTLLGQLDAIHEWLTRYGYNSTVSGNLPIIINQTNL